MHRHAITASGSLRKLLIVLGALACATSSSGDFITAATESFSYTNGPLAGLGPSAGFQDSWQDQGSDGGSGFSVAQGQAQGYGTLALYRGDLWATYGYPGTQVQFSFRVDFGNPSGVDYAGIELNYGNSSPRLFMGKPAGYGTATGPIVLETGGGAGRVSTGVQAVGVRNLVTTITFVPGNDQVQLNVYDDNGTLLGQAVKTDLDVFFNQVLLVSKTGGARLDNLQLLLSKPPYYDETYRPQFHFSTEHDWNNDPNGLVYYAGEYHMFFQTHPLWTPGGTSWGHAVSTDLIHWLQLPVAIPAENGINIWSGSAVVDWNNTSGFGMSNQPPLVAVYTGERASDNLQTQNIAYSTDRGRTWTKYSGNPVIDIGSTGFRDPKVFWHDATSRWIMVVSLADDRKVRFYSSLNLKNWTILSEFGPAGASSAPNWECPDLFPLPVDGEPGVSNWVLHVGIGNNAPAGGSGGQYFIGQFTGTNFVNNNSSATVLWEDFGKDNYAAVSWSDIPVTDGRRLWIGWLDDWQYAGAVPTVPWQGAMTIPRALGLKQLPVGLRLIEKPVDELKALRAAHSATGVLDIQGSFVSSVTGDVVEILANFQLETATEFGLRVRKGGSQQTLVGYSVAAQQLFVDRTSSGLTNFSSSFAGKHGGPLAPENNQITMHVFVDRSSVEVFGNDGEIVISDLIFPDPQSTGIEVYATGGSVRLVSLDIWPLNGIWPAVVEQITSMAREGNNVRTQWTTVGGRAYALQAASGTVAGGYSNNFADISAAMMVPGTNNSSTNYLELGTADAPQRYYRVRIIP